jgi:hypothetical protein
MLDTVLAECAERTEVTSQFLFNQMVLEAWKRRSLAQLNVTREAFADALRARGWSYDVKSHRWVRGARRGQEDLFGGEG